VATGFAPRFDPSLPGRGWRESLEAQRAVRQFVARGEHRERVSSAAALVMDRHADALRRLGE
jgi:hypothetical protein